MKTNVIFCIAFLVSAVDADSAFSQQPTAAQLLRDAYAISKNADTEGEYTLVIEKVSSVDLDKVQPEVTKYGEDLMAWALNRRGEIAWDRMKSIDDSDGKSAIRDFELALKLDPKRWRAMQNIAFVRAAMGDLKKADTLFTQVIAIKPDHANAYFNRGELRYEMGKLEDAIADYTQAIGLAPREADFYTSRAHAQFQVQNVGEAVDDYRRATEVDPSDAGRKIDLADALQTSGQWQESKDVYRQAVGLASANIRAKLNLAWLLATCPDSRVRSPREALQIINEVRDIPNEEQFRFIDTQAACFAAIGNFESAVRIATTGQNIAPEWERDDFKNRLEGYRNAKPYMQKIPQP